MWLGFPYPIVKTPNGYFGSNSTDIDQIKANLLQLLLTYPGERVMLPDFGTPLQDLIFEPNNSTLAARAKKMVIDSISMWEPRIAVDQINVTSTVPTNILSPDDDLTQTNAILTITIQFRNPNNITETEKLVLEVPLPGA